MFHNNDNMHTYSYLEAMRKIVSIELHTMPIYMKSWPKSAPVFILIKSYLSIFIYEMCPYSQKQDCLR